MNDIEFQIGDMVYAEDWCYGEIIDIDGEYALVEFDTGSGGGSCYFEICDLVLAED